MRVMPPVDLTANAVAAGSRDALLAVRNAVKLGGAMACSWGIALVARLLLPRYLGPEAFGPLNFADAFATTFFVVLGLGLDTYIRKEVPVRPEHASDFFGTMLALRLAGTGVVFAAMAVVLHLMHRPPEVIRLVFVFGAAQLFVTTNASLAALLHARGTVDGLSITNVLAKLVWGAGIVVTLLTGASLVGIPLALVVAEGGRCAVLWVLVRRNLAMRLRFELKTAAVVLLAALPFYLNGVAHTVYNKLDVSFLATMANDREVGWYGAASTLAGLTMMIAPMMGWVVMPLFARARARSQEEYTQVLRRSLELILAVAIPTTLAMGLGAVLWIELIFGSAFVPAALALRILAPQFLLTYVAMVCATRLVIDDRAWTVTVISLAGLVLNPLLNWLLIRPAMGFFAVAGGGAGCAVAQVLTELAVTGALLWVVGREAFDRRSLLMVAKALGACAAVVAFDWLLAPLGPARIVLDGLAYGALFVLLRAMPLRETLDFVRAALRRSRVQPTV